MKDKIKLNNGIEMPMIGFGVYQIPSSITQRCVEEAFSLFSLLELIKLRFNPLKSTVISSKAGENPNDISYKFSIW